MSRTYRLVRTRKVNGERVDEVLERGLSWPDVRAKALALDDAERERKPLETSWTRDLHMAELENPDPNPRAVLSPEVANALAEVDRELRIIRWCAGGTRLEDKRWWRELPEYKRVEWTHRYDAQVVSGRLKPAWLVEALADHDFRQHEKLAQAWANDLREAFKERRPCPIIPEPRYRHVLDWAFNLAQLDRENFTERVPQSEPAHASRW